MVKRKVLIYGLDGATWKLIKPLMEAGKLPNLQRLCESGSWGAIRSFEPIFSPIIWTSISSGKTPAKHGISAVQLNSGLLRCKRVWDILEEKGFSIALYGHLVTWPPRKINGYIIPDDLFSHGVETYPEELGFIRTLAYSVKNKKMSIGDYLSYFKKCLKFGIKPANLFKGFLFTAASIALRYSYLDVYYRVRFVKEAFRNDLFMKLHERYNCDFSFYYSGLVDNCCHLYWKYMEPGKFMNVSSGEIAKYRNIINNTYITADKFLGKMLKLAGPDTIVAVVSDHGFRAADVSEEGWDYIIKNENLLKTLGIADRITGYNLGSLSILRMREAHRGKEKEIMDLIGGITIKGDGERLFEVSMDDQANIQLIVRKKSSSMKGLAIEIPGGECGFHDLVEENDARISGVHDLDGIFVFSGDGIERGKKVEGASVLDFTPTLLALLGLPVGRDMDGKVMKGVIIPEYLKRYPIQYIDTYESKTGMNEAGNVEDTEISEEVKERLKALGYLG